MSSSSSALFEEHKAFAKRLAETSTLSTSSEKRQKVDRPSSQKSSRPKSSMARSKTSSDLMSEYHPTSTASKARFLVLTNIVEKLQERFLGGQTDSVTLDEIIQESSLTIDSSDRHWLTSQALLSNEKIDVKRVDDVNKFVYKPPLDLKGPKKVSLLNLLKSRHEKYEGAVTVEDVRETIPRTKADQIIQSLITNGDVMKVTSNKRDVLFYADRAHDLRVNPEFVESWRRISLEGLDEKKIGAFLGNHGYHSLAKGTSQATFLPVKAKRGGRRNNEMKHNLHVADQLQDFSNPPPAPSKK